MSLEEREVTDTMSLLLEIGTEEIPDWMIESALDQLREGSE